MSAPQIVVDAVMKQLGCQPYSTAFEIAACRTPHGSLTPWAYRGCAVAVEAADAAWKASLYAAAEKIDADCSEDDWGVPCAYSVTLRRWAEAAS